MRLALLPGILLVIPPQARAVDYFWDANGPLGAGTGGSGPWDTTSFLWRSYSDSGAASKWPQSYDWAWFRENPSHLTLEVPVTVNRLQFEVDGSLGANDDLLNLAGPGNIIDHPPMLDPLPGISVAQDKNVTLNVIMGGSNGLGKAGPGTLTLTNPLGRFLGGVSFDTGFSGTLKATWPAVETVFRSNNIASKSSDGLFLYDGPVTHVRTGGIAGINDMTRRVDLMASGLIQHLTDEGSSLFSQTYLGAAERGLIVRGMGGQGYYGTSAILGPISVHGVPTPGNGFGGSTRTTSSLLVFGGGTVPLHATNSVTAHGGTFMLDHGTNQVDYVSRYRDDAPVRLEAGGHFVLRGANPPLGVSELVGNLLMQPGASRIGVLHDMVNEPNPPGPGTDLVFTGGGNVRGAKPAVTLNFTAYQRVNSLDIPIPLGQIGDHARIKFSGNAFTGIGGLLSTTAGGSEVGWAVTRYGEHWAGYDAVTGIKPVPETARDSSTFNSTAPNEVTTLNMTDPVTTMTAPLAPSVLKLSGSTELALGVHDLTTAALLFSGGGSVTLTATTGRWLGGGRPRYAWVTSYASVLDYVGTLALTSTSPVIKSGPGTFAQSGPLEYSGPVKLHLIEGAWRATAAHLGGATSAGGANTTVHMRGGQLQISGGGTFTRALGVDGTAVGGGIRFSESADDHGSGGFSASNGDASITLVTTPGGGTPALLRWNDGAF